MRFLTVAFLAGTAAFASLDSLLEETQGNSLFWIETFRTLEGEELRCAEYLFRSIPRLDRLEMTEEALMDHIRGALSARDRYYPRGALPDSLFLQCVLSYRVDQEPVTGYRSELLEYWSRFRFLSLHDAHGSAFFMAETLHSFIELMDQGYLGGIEAPLVALSSGRATPSELTVLFCSSLKSLGIASRQITGWFAGVEGGRRRWVEVWLPEGVWEPLALPWDPVPDDFRGIALAVSETTGERVTGRYAHVGAIGYEPGDDPPGEDWMGMVTISVRSGFIPLDWLWFDPSKDTGFELGPNDYRFWFCGREEDGGVRVLTREVTLGPGEEVQIRLQPGEESVR